MICVVTYEPATGRITGRVRTTNAEILQHYPPSYVIVTDDEFNAEPELHKKVDVETKKLVDK